MINGLTDIFNANPAKNFPNMKIGDLLSSGLELILYLTGALMFIWLVWGIFQYIFAGGDKEALGKAQKRITYAIVGFLLVAIAFAISQYLQTIFPQNLPGGVTPITKPP